MCELVPTTCHFFMVSVSDVHFFTWGIKVYHPPQVPSRVFTWALASDKVTPDLFLCPPPALRMWAQVRLFEETNGPQRKRFALSRRNCFHLRSDVSERCLLTPVHVSAGEKKPTRSIPQTCENMCRAFSRVHCPLPAVLTSTAHGC